MSFRDRPGFARDGEVSGSHTSSKDNFDVERNGGDRFRVSTPTRLDPQVAYSSTEQLLPPDTYSGHSNFERNNFSGEYGSGYQNYGRPRPTRDTSVLLSDEVISGSLTSGNRMSPVRRFFCLLVTFDFLFTGLFWLITIIVQKGAIEQTLWDAIAHYTIHKSLFDIVILSFLRFTICIVFFAFLDLKHWWPIAVTTTISSGFLILKVFEFTWNETYISLDATLVLLSFIITWGEMWFLDFRVLPLETRAKEVLTSYGWIQSDERTRLMQSSSGTNQQNSGLLRYMDCGETETASISASNFYSPLATPENSDDDSLEGDAMDHRNRKLTSKNQSKVQAKEMLHLAWKTLTASTDWKYEKSCSETGDVIASRQSEEGRKIFKLTGQLDIPARILLEEIFYKVEDQPLWNPLTTECKIIKSVDRNTDIMHQVCAEGGGGAVSVRDFVYLRHWELVDGVYISAMISTKHSTVPPHQKRVRGESGPCCFAISQSEDIPNKCNFRWTLNTDLKIRLPKFILDNAIMNSQFTFMGHLRKRIIELKEELSLNDSI